jgi:hypothetical protein
LAHKPLVEYLPLVQRPTLATKTRSPSAAPKVPRMEICEVDRPGLKVDFSRPFHAGLIMRKACELIERYHAGHCINTPLIFRTSDPNDPNRRRVAQAFELRSARGRSATGVSQLESCGNAQRLAFPRCSPKKTFAEHIS